MIDFNRTAAPEPEKAPLNAEITTTALAPLDSNRACAEFITFVEEMNVIKKLATSIAVADDESLKESTRIAVQAKRMLKDIKALEDQIISPAKRFVSSVTGYCKNFTQPLNEIVSDMRVKQSRYEADLELEWRKREEEARKARETLQKELDKKAKKAGVESVTVPEIVIPKPDNIVRTDDGGASYKKRTWRGEIIDGNLVPREYCTPDARKINEAIRLGVREIPGVEIKEVITPVFRT